jgi:hypothetical protein
VFSHNIPNFIEGNVDVVASTLRVFLADSVKVGLAQVGPERSLLVAMGGNVENLENWEVRLQFRFCLCNAIKQKL